jgi:hypothetical protein
MEIPHYEERHARALLGIPQQTIKNSTDNSPSEQSERYMLTELYGGLSGGHLDVNKTLGKVQQRYYWLQARNDVEK